MILMNEFSSIDDEYVVEEYQPKIDPTLSEIQECCKSLGINKVSDPDLEYIAIELLRSPIPKGWKFYRNKTNPSSYFFYNSSTKMIQMQHPYYQKYLSIYNSEKQKKTESFIANSGSDDSIENSKEIEKLTQSHTQKINLLKKKIELDNLISELDSTDSKKLKKCVTAHDKYQLALQKYVDYSENNRVMLNDQIEDLEKTHLQKIAELKLIYDAEIKELKEQYERAKKEAETDLKRLQKGIEKKKEEEMRKFEKQLDEDKMQLVHKKFKRKLKIFNSKPIYINGSSAVILKRSQPISLDILDVELYNSSSASPRENFDKSSTQSQTEIPAFSINFNHTHNQLKTNSNKNKNQKANTNFNNNFIDIDIDDSDTSSSEVPPFLSKSLNKNWGIKESDKLVLQMGKTTSNLKESLDSNYNNINTEYKGIKALLDKQSMDLNKKNIEYQQKALEFNKELNTAISEIQNMNRMALNTINSLQASLTPRIYYPQFPPTSLTPQPRRTHAMPGTFDSDDYVIKNKSSTRSKNKNKNRNNDFDDDLKSDHRHEKNKTKKKRKTNTDDIFDEGFSSYDSSHDFSDLEEDTEQDELKNTTGFRKLKKFNDVFSNAQKAQARVNIDFKRAKQKLYE